MDVRLPADGRRVAKHAGDRLDRPHHVLLRLGRRLRILELPQRARSEHGRIPRATPAPAGRGTASRRGRGARRADRPSDACRLSRETRIAASLPSPPRAGRASSSGRTSDWPSRTRRCRRGSGSSPAAARPSRAPSLAAGRVGTDPHVRPRGRNRERANAFEIGLRLDGTAVRPPVAEAERPHLAPQAGTLVGHIPQPR
jgi:hypothetical protein